MTEGVGAALLYDYCCFRGYLFSEAYLSNCVGAILQSLHGGISAQVIGGYHHPRLASIQEGRGRRKEIDFVVAEYDDGSDTKRARSKLSPMHKSQDASRIATAVEAKWAGSSHCTLNNVVWDLVRLAMVKEDNPNATAILLLAGEKKELEKFAGKAKEVLKFEAGHFAMELLPESQKSRKRLAAVFNEQKLQKLSFPRRLQLACVKSTIEGQRADMFGVVAWRVETTSEKGNFVPELVTEYKSDLPTTKKT
ncbi:hypothetical protein [Paraburkholderia aspalathi]|uniref:hypothetical protein n=1 Tax=Paraburkholderia aspalathi TaxID=1324617 RepID=UPI003C906D7C